MAIMNFAVLCLVLVSTCFAEENQTVSLDAPSSIQKREKQHLIVEDDDSDGPSVKRDERQSIPSRTNLPENEVKVLQNSLNSKLKPKPVIPVQIKPVVKPKVIAKPIRVDTAAKRVPTKVPVVLKTGRVLPTPAQQALRLKVIESIKNNTYPKQDSEQNEAIPNIPGKIIPNIRNPKTIDDSIPFTIENKSSKKDAQDSKKGRKQTVKQEKKLTQEKDSDDSTEDDLARNGKISESKDQPDAAGNDKNIENKPTLNEEPVKVVPKPVLFYEDDVATEPLLVKKRLKFESQGSQSKVKEIPITRNPGAKLTSEESKYIDDDDPEAVHISNGTHLISIRKLRDDDKQSKSRHHIEEEKEPKVSIKGKQLVLSAPPDVKQRVGPTPTDPHSQEKSPTVHGKDPNDTILISNHDYEEVQERSTFPPAQINTPAITNPYNNGVQDSWNYLQNLYCNPYYPNLYNQYRRYYEEQDPQIYKDTNEFIQNYQTPEYANIPNDDDVVYNDFTRRSDQPEVDETYCPYKPQENSLERIWRTWKDVDIKIKNNNEDPVDIDIRRNLALDNCRNDVSTMPTHVTQPIGFNGYYNNQNSALLYPYYSPTYRYLR